MQVRIKKFSAVIMALASLPAWAQSGARSLAASAAASAPDAPNVIMIPDPAWFIAGLATGLVLGVIGARVFGSSRVSKG